MLGPVEIHANRIESVNDVLPTCTYTRIWIMTLVQNALKHKMPFSNVLITCQSQRKQISQLKY